MNELHTSIDQKFVGFQNMFMPVHQQMATLLV